MKRYLVSIITVHEDEAPDDRTIIQRAIYDCKMNDDISYIAISDKDGNIIAEVDENTEVPNV